MGRIVQTGDTPAKRRHRHMRSCAEVIRLLAERSSFDEEAKDMAAFLVFSLRDIYKTIDESAHAWDERNYWKKAEKLRQKWRWAYLKSEELKELVVAGNWQMIPPILIELLPEFSDITVTAITRDSDWWAGARRALLKEEAKAS